MRKKKQFDCVEMKWEIQKKIAEQYKNVQADAALKDQILKIQSNPIIGPFFEHMKNVTSKSSGSQRY